MFRKAAFVHPELYARTRDLILIAGANHGTTTCRGQDGLHVSAICDEVAPGRFGPDVAVAGDAPLQHRLPGLIGRDPAWSPPARLQARRREL